MTGTHPKLKLDELVKLALRQAWERVGTPDRHLWALELMTWEEHEQLLKHQHQSLRKIAPDCARYYDLVHSFQWQTPSDEELEWLEQHESSCETHMHSARSFEKDLDLPEDAFRSGSPQHGLLPSSELAEKIGREISQRETRQRLRLVEPLES
jgi:hypothetical protein